MHHPHLFLYSLVESPSLGNHTMDVVASYTGYRATHEPNANCHKPGLEAARHHDRHTHSHRHKSAGSKYVRTPCSTSHDGWTNVPLRLLSWPSLFAEAASPQICLRALSLEEKEPMFGHSCR